VQIQNLENISYVLRDEDNYSVLHASYNSSDSDKGHGMLCITSGVSFAIIWANSSVYLFDPHSRNNCGQIIDDGTSVLLKFPSLQDAENYIKEIYVPPEQERYLETQYFRIAINEPIRDKIMSSVRKKRTIDKNRRYRESEGGRALLIFFHLAFVFLIRIFLICILSKYLNSNFPFKKFGALELCCSKI